MEIVKIKLASLGLILVFFFTLNLLSWYVTDKVHYRTETVHEYYSEAQASVKFKKYSNKKEYYEKLENCYKVERSSVPFVEEVTLEKSISLGNFNTDKQ